MIKNLTTSEFKEQIFDYDKSSDFKITNENAVIIDFWAPWCGPCKMIGPVLEELDKKYDNIDIVKVNVDEEHEVGAAFGIRSIPTLLFVPLEGEPELVIGAQSKAQYEKLIEEILFQKEKA